MKVDLVTEEIAAASADLIVVLVNSSLESSSLDAASKGTKVDLRELLEEEGFGGEVATSRVFRGLGGLKSKRLAAVGVGDGSGHDYRRAGATAARLASELRAESVAIAVGEDAGAYAEQLVSGWHLGCYRYTRHLSNDEKRFAGPTALRLIGPGAESNQPLVERARMVTDAINFARDLVNDPPNELVPASLATAAGDIASTYGMSCKIFEESELHEEGFNLIMAVGKGSEHPPRLIHLTYRPEGEVNRKVAFVGKGVTFDTGGYNLKPGGSLLNMHCDMAGAAAVLGAAKAVGALAPRGVEIHFVVPTAENSIANNSFKPMDIFRGYGGKTVEIHNTDAEGRLILADALAYIQEHDVDTIIDLATLTGAAVVALGEEMAGLFSDDDELAGGLLSAAERSGEDFWRMPLNRKLDKGLDTANADMKNVGPRWGGAITAALFLKRWVDIGAWAHLDIAGPAWAEKESEIGPEGGTGFAVATLVEFIDQLSR